MVNTLDQAIQFIPPDYEEGKVHVSESQTMMLSEGALQVLHVQLSCAW